MSKNFKNTVLSILKNDSRIWNEDKTELNLTLLLDLVEKIDENIIDLLLQEQETRDKFFKRIKDIYVFKTNEFRFFMEENKVNNSFTDYKNRIGLSDGKRFLKDSGDVVLNFPYKDCVLEGGQSSEEGTDKYFQYEDEKTKTVKGQKITEEAGYKEKSSKRNEVFYNEIIAKDEIDRLTDDKALVNWKRFTKEGEEKVESIKRDKNGVIKENLVIKGNNFLALHSLEQEFTNKVKLIYIDPPYNTGGDANIFTYNNTFNHSTWLTFMRNRLLIGRKLIKNDGFIAIAIDHAELFYIGVLADEIFGRDNRIGLISVVHKPEGRQFANFFSPSNEFMLVYAKDKSRAEFNKIVLTKDKEVEFNLEDNISKYKLKNYIRLTDGKYSLRENKPDGYYPIYVSTDLTKASLKKLNDYHEVFPITEKGVERVWKTSGETFMKKFQQGDIVFRKEKGEIIIYEKLRLSQVFTTHWVKKEYHSYHFGTKLLEEILGRKAFSYPKSLYTVYDTLKIMTSDDDIILDFHAGSGTTGHATIDLNFDDGGNRQFILVEQLDEHIDICNERNQKVLAHKNIDTSFLYCELAKWNEEAKETINKAKSLDDLIRFFDEMYDKYFLNYNLNIKDFKEKVIHEDKFKSLSLDEQKRIFIAMLDVNQMYVNKTEMKDEKYAISQEDIRLTEEFYNESNT